MLVVAVAVAVVVAVVAVVAIVAVVVVVDDAVAVSVAGWLLFGGCWWLWLVGCD